MGIPPKRNCQTQLNAVYAERDLLVALLARIVENLDFPPFDSWRCKHEDKPGENWEDDWRNVIFITIPTGQLSWHVHDSEMHLFDHLALLDPSEFPECKWDGHTTEQKYERIREYLNNEKQKEQEYQI